MNRFRLRLFRPVAEPATAEKDLTDADPPHVIPFRPRHHATVISGRFTAPAVQAQAIRENSVCPECSAIDVEPLKLEDDVISPRSHLPIPGTATIVGFHCNHCGTEWPVYEMTVRRNS